jgi:hypothetical protein
VAEVLGAIVGGFLGLGVGLTVVSLTAKVVAGCWRELSGFFQKK